MEENTIPNRSIPEQVYDEFITSIRKYKEFDTKTIEKIQELINNSNLSRAPQIVKAIKVLLEDEA